ncbi:hypothetical protein V6N13_093203 [Hibiscus sabdariffa]
MLRCSGELEFVLVGTLRIKYGTSNCVGPPENVVSMEECSILDRPRSPGAMVLQPASKKDQNFEDPMEVSK